MELPLRILNTNGTPKTGLVTADFKITKYDDEATVYPWGTASEIGDGNYRLDSILFSERPCKLYINDVEQTWLGIIYLGERASQYCDLSTAQTIAGNKTFSGTIVLPSTTSIGDVSATELGYVNGVTSAIQTQLDATVKTTGNQTIAGDKTFSGTVSVETAVSESSPPTLKQLNDGLASVAVAPYQESSQHRRVITNGTIETGKVYKTIANAISSIATPSVSNQGYVEIVGIPGSIALSHASLVDYVHVIGQRHHNVLLGYTGTSVSKVMTFKGVTLWMSNYSPAGVRSYSNMTFEDCVIYAFNFVTFTNCKLRNCMIYQKSGDAVNITGSTEMINCVCTQAFDEDPPDISGFIANTTMEALTSYSMPADPFEP